MRRPLTLAAAAVLVLSAAAPARAADPEKVNEAIDRAAEWLWSQQKPDGHWEAKYTDAYPMGPTALATWALLKAGADPNDPRIVRAFEWLRKRPLRRTYSVSCLIMALEARSAPPPEKVDQSKPYETVARKVIRRRMPGPDKALLAQAAKWLLTVQGREGMWKYPGHGEEDLSNAQFAVLALKAAERVGVKLPAEPFAVHAAKMIEMQEQDGPVVPWFEVPAGQGPIALLDPRAIAEWEAQTRTRTRQGEMRARGFAYRPKDVPRGSMTAAGVATMIVCKSILERSDKWEQSYGQKTDASIRDGMAWLAERFSVEKNPQAGQSEKDWLYYYLFTLERAATLSGVERLGGHDWYDRGADFLLAEQQGDGRWEPEYGDAERCGAINDTAFAILFLRRATPPVMQRPTTGTPRVGEGSTTDDGAVGGVNGPLIRATGDGRFEAIFSLPATRGASRVHLAGSFNGWSKDATPLTKQGDRWTATVTLDRGRHTYKFVIDGGREWIRDPENPDAEPDGHGGKNSVLDLK